MPLTIINGASASVNDTPIFSASINEGLNLQTSGVLNGSRLKPVAYEGVKSGSANVSAPPGSGIVTSAIAQLVEAPTAIAVFLTDGTKKVNLAEAICNNFSINFSGADSEVQVSMGFEGAAVSESTVVAPTVTPVAVVLGKDVTVSGAVTGCVLEASISISTSYDKKTCLGSDTPSLAVGGLYEAKGTASFMLAAGGSLTAGGDLAFDVGGEFTLTINNIVLNRTWEISGPNGTMVNAEFTGVASGAEAAFAFS